MENIIDTICAKADEASIRQAGQILKRGGLVAFPTETVYGLGADALNEDAAAKIYAAKGRPSDNPLIVHITERKMLDGIVSEVSPQAELLMEKFWPGPMTLIFKKSDLVPYGTTGGLDTVAVRMPSHPIARAVIDAGGGYIAAPSANTSGRPSPTKASHVEEDLCGKIDMILDGGEVDIGLESTIVDVSTDQPMILRPGYISQAMLKEVIGPVEIDRALLLDSSKAHPKAPGMKYKHYAPRAEMIIFSGEREKVKLAMAEEKMHRAAQGQKVEVIVYDDADPQTAAHDFFARLRACDKKGVDVILAAALKEDGIGFAVMNRMFKSAGYHIKEVL